MFDLGLLLYFIRPFITLVKRTVLVVIVLFAIFKLFLYFSHFGVANTQAVNPLKLERERFLQTYNDPKLKDQPQNLATFTVSRMNLCLFYGEVCTDSTTESNIQNTFLGKATNFVTLPLKTPPSSGILWAQSTLQDAGMVPRANAAVGVGLASLLPFRDIWLIFRNFSFLLMVLMMVIIGFLIMFRTKINAQTVISLENALPKIIISMIMITFSFAIAGLMIDLMYVTIGVVIQLFSANAAAPFNASQFINQVFYGDTTTLLGLVTGTVDVNSVGSALYSYVPWQLQNLLEQIVGLFGWKFSLAIASWFLLSQFKLSAAGGTLGAKFQLWSKNIITPWKNFNNTFDATTGLFTHTGTGGTVLVSLIGSLLVFFAQAWISSWLGPILIHALLDLILYFSLLFIVARLFFMFLSAYVQILLLVVFSPFILLLEMLPGKSMFSSWIKSLFINLLTFPLAITLILLARAIMTTYAGPQALQTANHAGQYPPLWAPPFLYGMNSEAFSAVIGGAILFMSPDLVKSFKEMTGIKPMQGMSLKLGSFFAGTAVVGAALGVAGQYHSLASMFLGPTRSHEAFQSLPIVSWFVNRASKKTDNLANKSITPGASQTKVT
jgi:hypothetical protein